MWIDQCLYISEGIKRNYLRRSFHKEERMKKPFGGEER